MITRSPQRLTTGTAALVSSLLRGLLALVSAAALIRDTKVGLGIETQLAFVNELEAGSATERTGISHEFLVGPSLQIRPLPQMHIDFAPLFGTTKASPRSKVFVVMGWEF